VLTLSFLFVVVDDVVVLAFGGGLDDEVLDAGGHLFQVGYGHYHL